MPDLRAQLESTLGSSYTIERELGGGGMSRVFVAQETRFARAVVIKVLTPDLAAGLSAERFEREIRLAAQLAQANIVPVLGAGEIAADGGSVALPYYTMPFIDGESLRARLGRGELPVAEAVAILRDVARALAYAHSHGVVHRDIKPENVLLSGGAAVVTDFGIAKALSASRTQAPGGTLTVAGTSLGTPAYMAPEQAVGDQVDERADLYAWGVVAYELLSGRHPFAGKTTAQQLISAHIAERPRELTELRAGVPSGLASLVMRCLEKDPAVRPRSAAEVLQLLERFPVVGNSDWSDGVAAPARGRPAVSFTVRSLAAAAIALAVLGAVTAGRGRIAAALHLSGSAQTEAAESGPSAASVTRLAVLPFENIGDSADAYFADGVTDAVRGKLTLLAGLQVIASNSSDEYANTTKGPREIARELGVDYLLEGKVRWAKQADGASRVQVSPELIDVSSASAAWQQSFDAPLTDVFQVQADIASRVARALDVALGAGEEQHISERPTENLAAYDAFLRGEKLSGSISVLDPVTLRRAATYYEQATALDPSFALAWAQLSRAYTTVYTGAAPSPVLAEAARKAAERATELAPDEVGSYLALGRYYAAIDRDHAASLAAYTAGLQLSPDNAELLAASASAEQNLGQWDSALVHLERAAALDPRSVRTASRLGGALLSLRRYPEARAAFDRGLALAPTNIAMLEHRAQVELSRGDLAAARAVVASAPREVDATALVAFFGTYDDLYWVLTDVQQQLLLRLSPAPFDNNRAAWGLVLAQSYWLRGDSVHARAYADSARVAFEEQLRMAPEDAQLHTLHGVALAYAGRTADAIREGQRGVAMLPITKDAYLGPYLQHQLARIYLLAGEQEKALDELEPLLKVPYFLSPGWLRIDPTFDPLRGNPRFERLAKGEVAS